MTDASIERLRHAIASLEAQRDTIGHASAELALAPLREQLARLHGTLAAQQLRQVSVLFADVVGAAALGSRIDPEELHDIVDATLVAFTRAVQQHGGQVLQYAGDSLLAAFGTPRAHEDDAERAVHAGLAVLAEARALAATVQQRFGHAGFGVRAGIATGSVLLGGGVDGDGSIRGATVNLAARLEQTALPGTLALCADTRRLVRGQFELEARPPLVLKGFEAPLATWRVLGPAREAPVHAARGVGGVASPLVGRTSELARLLQAHADWRAATPRRLCGLLLVADAGLGKSRLADEFKRQAPGRWLRTQAGERDGGRPFGVLRQLFDRALGLLASDTAAEARARWLAALAPLLAREGDAAVLGQWLGLDFGSHPDVQPLAGEARALHERGRFHAVQALRAMAAGEPPLMLLLEDLHWADAGTLDFIAHLHAAHADLPVLLLATTRPGAGVVPGPLAVALPPLAGDDARALAHALLARLGDVPAELAERLTARAEGNPFFMEEWVNMLIDRGVITPAEGRWRFDAGRLAEARLPSTLFGVLQARLDTLAADETHALQLASVIGHAFWDDALRALGVDPAALLPALLQRGLIVERPASSLEGRREYSFGHHLLHQVCYERVLRRVRVPAHARVAAWLEAQPGERPLDLVAEHYERGYEPDRACNAWHAAAEAARVRYANAQALAHAERALRLCAEADLERRSALALLRARVLFHQGESELPAELDRLDQLAAALDDDLRRCEAADLRARHLYARGDAEASLAIAEQALALARRVSPPLATRLGQTAVNALHMLGRLADAQARAQAVLAQARELGDRSAEGAMLNLLGIIADDGGDLGTACARYAEALACHRAAGHSSYEAGVLSNLGYAALGLGDYAAAQRSFADARALFGRIGERQKEGLVLINLALAALHAGDAGGALAHTTEALPLLQACGCHWGEAAAWRVAGQARLALQQAAEARALLHAAWQRFGELRLRHLAIEALAGLAWARWQAGDETGALADARAVAAELAAGTSVDGAEEPLRVYLDTWRVLQAAGDAGAEAVLDAALAVLQQRLSRLGDAAQRTQAMQQVPHHRALLAARGGG